MSAISKFLAAVMGGLRKITLRVFTVWATLAFAVALMLIIWLGGWETQYQKQQLQYLGWGFLGSVGVWAINQIGIVGVVRDLTFKAGAVEASLDFDDEENPNAGQAG